MVLVGLAGACTGKGTGPRNTTFPATGKPRWDYELRNGLVHGKSTVWWENGRKRSEGEYIEGAKHGLWSFYYEAGGFEYQALYWKDRVEWVAVDELAKPPAALLAKLATDSPAVSGTMRPVVTRRRGLYYSVEPPAPYFATLDRTTALSRLGLGIGLGLGENLVVRSEVFANYLFGNWGAYGQYAQASYDLTPDTNLSARRTLELGATRTFELSRVGLLTLRGGVLGAVANDDHEGFVASVATSSLRATDAAATFPSSVAVRTSASLGRSHRRVVWQTDGGVDWLMGGREREVDPLLRLNAALGIGVRSTMFSAELSNTVRLAEPSRSLHVGALAATIWLQHLWLTSAASLSHDGEFGITTAAGYGW